MAELSGPAIVPEEDEDVEEEAWGVAEESAGRDLTRPSKASFPTIVKMRGCH
jgi:hypothetical protein